jgi:hypothetical protein
MIRLKVSIVTLFVPPGDFGSNAEKRHRCEHRWLAC